MEVGEGKGMWDHNGTMKCKPQTIGLLSLVVSGGIDYVTDPF